MASFYGFEPQNPLFLGTAQYPSPAILAEAVKRSGAEVVTASLIVWQPAVFGTDWIKLEVIGEDDTLQPDVIALVEAARILADDGFKVFPYTTEDIVIGGRLLDAGCEVLMPWGAPIGSGRGLNNPYGLRSMRQHFPDIPLVVDAGIGLPSHAAQAMELGYDGILLNTAVAKAGDPAAMAEAFALAIRAGRQAFAAQPIEARDMAAPSTPVMGKAFLA